MISYDCMDDFDYQLRDAENSGVPITGRFDLTGDVRDYPFTEITFSNTFIKGGSFSGSIFKKCVFENTTFQGVDLSMVNFVDCDLSSLDIVI